MLPGNDVNNGTRHKAYFCQVCPFKSEDMNTVDTHMLTSHQLRRFWCDKCRVSFGTKKAARRHEENIHLQRYIYNCGICGKGYHHKDRYSSHMREHGEQID